MPFHLDFPGVFWKLSESQNFQAEEFTPAVSLDTVSEGDTASFFRICWISAQWNIEIT